MRYLCLLVSLLLLSFTLHAEDFLSGTADVPLMDGLQIDTDDTFWMDEQDGNGRLFFAKATSTQKPKNVYLFYEKTLPQLGWQQKQSGVFFRDGDTLKLSAESKNATTEVVFELITK